MKKRRMKAIDAMSKMKAKTIDGFINLTQKIGLGANNSLSQGQYVTSGITKDAQKLENMYRGSWLVGIGVDALAEDMTREGIELTGEIPPDEKEQMQKAFLRKGIWSSLQESIIWGRLYGGAIGVIVIDGQKAESPLDISTVAKGAFKGIKVYDRHQVRPSTQELIDEGGINDGLPKFYSVNGSDIKWHFSRVIRQVGTKLPQQQKIHEEYWGASIIERVETAIVSFDSATAGAGGLLSKAHLRTVGVKDLRKILASGGQAEENLVTMFKLMGYLQSTEGITLVDSEDELSTHSYTFSGLDKMMLQFGQQVAGAFQTPLVRLFGMSPSGLNSSGEADLRTYHDGVKKRQESDLGEPMSRLVPIQYRSLFGQPPPEDLNFEFVGLWQLTETEKADIASKTTASVVLAHQEGIVNDTISMMELKNSSKITGLFGSITTEDIEETKTPEPPLPEEEPDAEGLKE
jgi:hypothetical protein